MANYTPQVTKKGEDIDRYQKAFDLLNDPQKMEETRKLLLDLSENRPKTPDIHSVVWNGLYLGLEQKSKFRNWHEGFFYGFGYTLDEIAVKLVEASND